MTEKKEKFSLVKKIDDGSVRFGDNAKREVVGVGSVKVNPLVI